MCFGINDLSAGIRQYKMLSLEADIAKLQADAAIETADINAQLLRDEGLRRVEAARAALAAAGVNPDIGSGEYIQKDIQQQAEQDALVTQSSGRNAANELRLSATINDLNAKYALQEGVYNSLESAARIASGGFTGTS